MCLSSFTACQGPLSRFGDTAANAGSLALLDSYEATKGLNVGLKTLVASTSAGLFRIFLMPIDACKTILQARSTSLGCVRTASHKLLWCHARAL